MSQSTRSDADAWKIFQVEDLMAKVAGNQAKLHEFIRVPTMSSAVYRLPVGCKDMQSPHLEDEIYFVVEGKATLRIDDVDQQVRPGSILYVRANTQHSFFNIEEDLTVLAFFGALPGMLKK